MQTVWASPAFHRRRPPSSTWRGLRATRRRSLRDGLKATCAAARQALHCIVDDRHLIVDDALVQSVSRQPPLIHTEPPLHQQRRNEHRVQIIGRRRGIGGQGGGEGGLDLPLDRIAGSDDLGIAVGTPPELPEVAEVALRYVRARLCELTRFPGDEASPRLEGRPRTVDILESAFEMAYTADYEPLCTFCSTNPVTDTENSVWIDHILLHNLSADAVLSTERVYDEDVVDVGEEQMVPLSDHFGMRSVIVVQ